MVNSRSVKRQRLSVDARRRQLVGVGVELIATQSWDGLTMNDIADAAEVSKPLLYHYFSTKRELYLAAVRSAADQLQGATTPDPALPPRERLRRALGAHVDWIDAHAPEYRTVLQGGVSSDPDVRVIVEISRAETVRRLAESMDIDHPPPALRIALRGWVGFLESACLDWLAHRDLTKAQLVELLAAALPGAVRAADHLD